jgi:hypothetical protein
MRTILLTAALLLAGCASAEFDTGPAWNRLKTEIKPMTPDQAIARLGIPLDERFVSGKKVLTWGTGGSQSYCKFSVMYDGDKSVDGNYDGQYGPCVEWLRSKGYMKDPWR